jgi:3-hydroxyisobutyrate dehydrogenase
MNVGFIGLGNIGGACAQHLAASEFKLWVHDLNAQAGEALVAAGATWAESCTAIAEACDVIFTSLPGPAQVESVLFGKNAIAQAGRDVVVVDLSTISLSAARSHYQRARESGFAYLDCPVSGGVWAIAERQLSLMPSGDRSAFDRALPAMQVFGRDDTQFLGEAGTGTLIKLINNQLFLVGGQVFQEGYLLAAKAGLDIRQFVEVVRGSSGGMYAPLASMVTQRQWQESSYDLALAEKDLYLALQSARDLQAPLPLTQAAHQTLLAAQAQGLGENFFLATMEALEQGANFTAPAVDVDG